MSDEFNGLDGLSDELLSAERKLDILTQFKAHVKKTLVNEQVCVKYFENLSRLLVERGSNRRRGNDGDDVVFALAHSALCYLIKRVAMQAQHKFQHDLIELIVSTLFSIPFADKKVWQSSVKALEAIYLAKPNEFCRVLNESIAYNGSIRTNVLLLIDELARMESSNGRNGSMFLQKFIPFWVQEMNTNDSISNTDIELIYDIVANRCPEPMVRSMVDSVIRESAAKVFKSRLVGKLNNHGSESDTKDDFDRSITHTNSINSQVFNLQNELQSIMHQAPQFPTVPAPEPISYSNLSYLIKDLESMLPAFEGSRETEQNWKIRQTNVIKLRSIVLGNVSTEFPDKFLELWKDLNLQYCVTKSALSLRTSLCTHGCSLVKDLCCVFNSMLDISIIENLWSCLAKLMSNTKKIANQNAFICLITLLSTVPFHSRLFNHCFALIRDKNNVSRLYSSTFLRILIVRFHKRLISQHHVYVEEWLQKGLTDAQTTIRESMRITFWYWFKVSPMSGKKMLNLFQPQIKRALENSIPTHLDINYEAAIPPQSKESSRRSSLLPKRFPSYAAPTQSSHLPRSSIKRSLTDLAQGTQSFSKRSLRTPPDHDMNIDLTSELTNSQTNPLLNRYMKREEVEPEPLHVILSKDPKLGLDLLQKYLLSDTKIGDEEKVQSAIVSLIRTNPKAFKPLLHLPKFYQLIPLNFSMVLLPLNDLDISMIETQFKTYDIINNVISILQSLEDKNSEWSIFYVRFKYQIYNFCFNTIAKMLNTVTLSDQLINELINACGKDMDAEKYYKLILNIYLADKTKFVRLLKSTSTASTKLKIANVIQKKDSEFKIKSILNYPSVPEPIVSPEEHHLLEMTMVNPLGKRTVSSNTVIHNSLEGLDESESNPNIIADEDNHSEKEDLVTVPPVAKNSVNTVSFVADSPSDSDNDDTKKNGSDVVDHEEIRDHEEPHGFTKFGGFSKLTEMTKVHSVFQPETVDENVDPMEVDSPDESNLDQKSLLTDIFLKNQHQEGSVSPIFKPQELNNDPRHDYDSNMLSDAINGIEIKTNDGSVANRSEDDIKTLGTNMGSVSDPKTFKPINLAHFANDSLFSFELKFIDASIGIVNLTQLKLIVQSIINNGTFKMNELQYILKCFLCYDQEVLEWIHDQHELKDVWAITELLLSSSSSESQIPTNIAYKSIILTACLLTIDDELEHTVLKDSSISQLFEHIISLVAKLDTFENEIYFACTELRTLLLSQDNNKHLPSFLEKCLKALCDTKEQYIVKISFLLETINGIISSMGNLLSVDVLRDLAKTISRYTPSDVAEWRFASCTALATIYSQLISRSTPVGYIRSLMPLLDPSDFEVVRSLSTTKDATRRLG